MKTYDFSSNINFVKPNVNIDLNTLPLDEYPTYDSLYEKLAQNYGVNTNQIELFNGISSAIFSLFRFLDLENCAIYSPANLEYKKACVNFSYQIRTINRHEDIYLPLKEGSLVIFENPSLIDGVYVDIEKLLEYWSEKNCTVLIDETQFDFCDGISAITKLQSYDKLYILKSMASFYGVAGISVCSIISNETNVSSIKKFEPNYKISTFDANYLQAILEDKGFKTVAKAINLKSKMQLEKILKQCELFEKVYDSKANYFLVKLKNLTSKEFLKMLSVYDIQIVDCSIFDYLDESFVRISVKNSQSNQVLKEALEKLC